MRIAILATGAVAGLTLFCGLSSVGAQDRDDPTAPEFAPLVVQTMDQRAVGRCLGDMVGFSNVRLQCVIDERATPARCVLINPTRATQRYERVFQCMASKMRVTHEDGSSAAGLVFEVSLDGKGVLSDDEYQRLRNEERNNP